MPRAQGDVSVTLSVLDRLIDTQPKSTSEAPFTRAQSVRHLKNSVRRDLEWLLNTRRIAVEPDESLKEIQRSLYVYGLPDFTSYSLASPKDHAKLLRHLQAVIKHFEPRLANVQVVPLEESARRERALRLRIEGLLMMDPAPEHVTFDTVIDLATGAYRVKGDADAG